MVRPKSGKQVQRVVWRISKEHPKGVLVKLSDPGFNAACPSTVHEHGFAVSSLDLLSGVDVTEAPFDSLPGELTDAFGKVVGKS